jgi:multidrug/hemolysin transport system ATP-binding protein
MDKILEVKGLKKSYGDVKAVKGIDFYVERGKLFAFLGPNGAGKSTTIDMICTFLTPDEGAVVIDGWKLGVDDNEIRSTIGAVFQDSLLDPLLTVKENLYTRGSFYGLDKEDLRLAVEEATHASGIAGFINRPYGKLSGGQRRRADIARALINTPQILFLDEPTTGLDPQTRKSVWETIRALQEKWGMTIFLTTHYMEEAADANYVIVIDEGNISAKGTPAELKEQYSTDVLKLTADDTVKLMHLLKEENVAYESVADQFVINIANTMSAIEIIERCKPYISGFEVLRGTLDDAFIGITGKECRE